MRSRILTLIFLSAVASGGEGAPDLPPGLLALSGHWLSTPSGEIRAEAASTSAAVVAAKDLETSAAEVSAEIRFNSSQSGPAGILVKVPLPDSTVAEADEKTSELMAYEVRLDPSSGKILLGLHRHGWQLLQEDVCTIPAGQWLQLKIRITTEGVLQVSLNGKEITRYENSEDPIPPGSAALSASGTGVAFRRFQINAKDSRREWFPPRDEPAGH